MTNQKANECSIDCRLGFHLPLPTVTRFQEVESLVKNSLEHDK